MKSGVRWLIVVAAILALPAMGYAQEAVITGTVTDSTGGVLPGVTVTAVLHCCSEPGTTRFST